MKQLLKITFALAFVAIWGTAQAQHDHPGSGKGGHSQMMQESLGLDEAQTKKMEAIHEKYHAQTKALWADESMTPEAKHTQMQTLRTAKHKEINAILTPEQQAKAEAMHAEGGHQGQGSHHGSGGHHGQGGGWHGQGGKHMHGGPNGEKLEAIAQAQRTKLEGQISTADKAEIASLRSQMADLHTQMKAAHQAMRSTHQAGEAPSDTQRAEMDKFHTQKRQIMDQAVVIAARYKTQILALHEEVKPQVEAIMKEAEAQRLQHQQAQGKDQDHSGKGQGHHGKGHGDCQGKGGMHHGQMGQHPDGQNDHMMAWFILMDPNAPAQNSSSKVGSDQPAASMELVVYPNPANTSNTIRYHLPVASKVRIELLSIDGKVLKVLQDGRQEAGDHTLEVNLSDLSAGTYMYRLVDAAASRIGRFSVAR